MFKVLYIDDEPDMVEDLPPLLKQWGLDLTARESVQEALDLFPQGVFDAVLLDCCMPPTPDMPLATVEYGRETGVEVARRLKEQRPDIPIVALTVVKDPNIQARMHDAGVCHIIHKPSDVSPIAEDLLNVIKRSRLGREA